MTKPSRSAARSLRSALVPAAMLAAFAASSLGGEREASAVVSAVASAVVSKLVTNTLACAISGTSDWVKCTMTGQTGSNVLTSGDINNIKTALHDELQAYELDDLVDSVTNLVHTSANYSRNVASTEGSSYQTAYDIWKEADDLAGKLNDHGLNGSASYAVAAAIRVAFAREQYEVMTLRNMITNTVVHEPVNINTAMVTTKSGATEALAQLAAFSAMVDSGVGAIVEDTNNIGSSTDCPSMLIWERHHKTYCFSNPLSGKTCENYYWCEFHSNALSDKNYYSRDTDRIHRAKINIARQKALMAYRTATIGTSVYEQIKEYSKIAAGNFEYCGNNTCSIGEIDLSDLNPSQPTPNHGCTSDCTAGSDYESRNVNDTSHTIWSSGTTTTLLQNSDAYLIWNNGNLQIKTWSGSVVWETRTSSTYSSPAATTLVLQSDGNFVIYSSSTPLWSTGTVAKTVTTTTTTDNTTVTVNKGAKLALVGKVLHVVDQYGASLWNSETSNANYTELHQPFCYSKSEARTLISTDQGKLNWQADGNLALYRGTTQVWGTGTNGQAEYVCMQEDGNFIIYNNQYTKLWSTGSYGLPGAYLSMKDSRLRVSNAADNPIWTVNYCTQQGAACNDDGQQKFVAMDGTCYQASQHKTVLRADDSALVFQSDGNLVLYKEDGTGAVRWASGTSGAANKLCLQADGNLVIYNGSNPLWHSSTYGNSSATLQLAGCNLSINKAAYANTSDTLWTTHTSCE